MYYNYNKFEQSSQTDGGTGETIDAVDGYGNRLLDPQRLISSLSAFRKTCR